MLNSGKLNSITAQLCNGQERHIHTISLLGLHIQYSVSWGIDNFCNQLLVGGRKRKIPGVKKASSRPSSVKELALPIQHFFFHFNLYISSISIYCMLSHKQLTLLGKLMRTYISKHYHWCNVFLRYRTFSFQQQKCSSFSEQICRMVPINCNMHSTLSHGSRKQVTIQITWF